MAYDVNTDYKAREAELRKQLEAETDAAKKAALQSQIDANSGMRTEKLASDLNKYGKYATDSELDSAAGLQAQNQVGMTYDTQARNINANFDQYKQNANNDALSRGMARSTFVSDRMANLDSQRANALQGVDASKALALQNAKTSIIDNYRTNTANALANEKNEFANTIGAYSNDYQAKINEVTNDGDASNNWQIQALQAARNAKLLEQYGTTDETAIAQAKAAATTTTSGGAKTTNGVVTTKTILPDALVAQIGMNRTNAGRVAAIEQLYVSGKITEVQAKALADKFNLG